jgi:hypothetical protein
MSCKSRAGGTDHRVNRPVGLRDIRDLCRLRAQSGLGNRPHDRGRHDPTNARFGLYHELGHEFDVRYFTDADRAQFTAWLGQETGGRPVPWVEVEQAPDGNGDMDYFANAYAQCALGTQTNPLNIDQRICRLIDRIGASEGASPALYPAAGGCESLRGRGAARRTTGRRKPATRPAPSRTRRVSDVQACLQPARHGPPLGERVGHAVEIDRVQVRGVGPCVYTRSGPLVPTVA